MATGVVISIFCFLGLFGVINTLLPTPAIVPILLYIGLLIGAQAFAAVPKAHYAAVVIAIIPNIASWAQSQIDNALGAAGTSAAQVGEAKLEGNSVVYHGLLILGSGAVLAGMVLGAIVVFIIDRDFIRAGITCVIASVLVFAGIIHAEKVEWNANGGMSLGFLFAAVVCFGFALTHPTRREKEPDEIAMDALEGIAPAEQAGGAPEPAGQTVQDRGAGAASPVAG